MSKLRVLDLFSGIGGFSLGLERTGGFETTAFCEIDPFCHKVLRKHWPDVPIFQDVKALTSESLPAAIDVICGGFPCQDISHAGYGEGIIEGTRSGLWFEIERLIGELRPSYVIVENVAKLLDRGMGIVIGGLARLRYDAEWTIIRGTDVGIPQLRPRVFIVAYPTRSCGKPLLHQNALDVKSNNSWVYDEGSSDANVNHESSGPRSVSLLGNSVRASIPHRERSGNNERLSVGLDRYRVLGNTVLPQIPELIGRAILASRLEKAA